MKKFLNGKMVIVGVLVLLSVLIVGCSSNDGESKSKSLDASLIEKLSKTEKIEIKRTALQGDRVLGEIDKEEVVEEILEMIKNSKLPEADACTCEGPGLYFDMEDGDGNVLETLGVFPSGRISLKDMEGCCSYFLGSNTRPLYQIIEDETEFRFFSLLNVSGCDDGGRLIYDDGRYKYYTVCSKDKNIQVEFTYRKKRLFLEDALKEKILDVDQLLEEYDTLFYMK